MAKEEDTRQAASEGTPTDRAEALKTELFGSDLTVAEVAHILDVDRTTVLRYLRDNTIFGYQLGREWRIPESDLRTYRQQLMNERRKEVRHTASEAEIDKKLPLLNARALDDDESPWRKIWCSSCAGPVLGELQFDEDAGTAWYDGRCDWCNERVSESIHRRSWHTPTPLPPTPNQPASSPPFEEDEGDMPF